MKVLVVSENKRSQPCPNSNAISSSGVHHVTAALKGKDPEYAVCHKALRVCENVAYQRQDYADPATRRASLAARTKELRAILAVRPPRWLGLAALNTHQEAPNARKSHVPQVI